MNVLVTGGAGYIGSHTCISLIEAGHQPVVLDNFCNSSPESLARVFEITGRRIALIEADVLDEAAVYETLISHSIDAVVHFAGLKSVAESVREPARYFRTNVGGSECVARAMIRANKNILIFSSSASVYGHGHVDENALTTTPSPYAESKLAGEQVLRQFARNSPLRIALLRYFNPVGAHPSGKVGEDPAGIPNNLMPYICQVAAGRRPNLSVFGNDYETRDGTGVRDYIHVMDLAEGHVAALNYLVERSAGEVFLCNLGSGEGHSVFEVIHTFEEANNLSIPLEIAPRRPGDVASYYANAALAERVLHWRTKRSLADMCRDAWNWQRQNPNGYR